MDFDVLVIGELNVDFVLRGKDVTPEFGQKEKLITDAQLTLGASAAIFACQAARLGLRTAFVGLVGADAFGRIVLDELETRGVDTHACIVDASLKTGVSVHLVRACGDRAMLTYPGSIGALRAEQVDRALLARARHLHIASYFLLDALRPDLPRLLAEAKRAGTSISLDTNWDPTEQWNTDAVLAACDIFLPNEAELLALTRRNDLDHAVAFLAERIPVIAVKQGARGAIARRGKETAQCDALPIQVVDTIGAGDSFDAGFVFGYVRNWSLVETLRFACVCGSLSTRGAGGIAHQPTLDEALKGSAL